MPTILKSNTKIKTMMGNFNASKKQFKVIFGKIIKENRSHEFDEAAFPAYSHKNPLIDWLFWERIKISYKYANRNQKINRIFDFGSGSEVLSYMLAKKGYDITTCDIEFTPLKLLKKTIEFPENIEFIEGDILPINLESNSFNIIYALDVLEHIDNFEPYIKLFDRLLNHNGVIVISGPTENAFYKIGRRIAGKRFTGDYYGTNISEIKKKITSYFKVTLLKKLLFPLGLFEVFIAKKKIIHNIKS